MYVFKGRVFLSGKVRPREGNGKKFTHPIHRSRILLLTKLPATQASLKKKQKQRKNKNKEQKTKIKQKQKENKKKNKNKKQKENKENQKYLEQGRNLPDSLVWATGKLKCEQQ